MPMPTQPTTNTKIVAGEMAAWASVPSTETIAKSMKVISSRETIIPIMGRARRSRASVWFCGSRICGGVDGTASPYVML